MKRFSRKTLITAAIVSLFLGGSAGALYWNTTRENKPPETTDTSHGNNQEPQFPGPTDQETKETEAHKDEVIKQQEIESNPPAAQKSVTPVVTNVNQSGQEIFASGFVPGIFEDGGSCSFVFTKGSLRITKNVNAFANASTTNCANVTVARSEFAQAGNWSLAITYSSPRATGVSQTKEFMVQ